MYKSKNINHKPLKNLTFRNTLNPFKINDQPPCQLILNKNGDKIFLTRSALERNEPPRL